MKQSKPVRVLVVAPGQNGQGGIASVVRQHMSTPMWQAMRCRLLSTFVDGHLGAKLLVALRGYLAAPFAIADADLVHLHVAGESSLLRKLPILALSKVFGRRVIVHLHASGEESLFARTPRWASRYALRAADRVVVLSPTWSRLVKQYLPGCRTVVIANPVRPPVDIRRSRRELRRVLFVGKLERRKGYDTLIRAAALVRREFPETQFLFAGHGDLQQASDLAESLSLAPPIQLLGWLGPHQMEATLREADIFCLPSHDEGVPMAMLEAMSYGLPVVCTPVGGIPDVLLQGRNGLLVKPGDAEAVAEALLRLLRNPEWAAGLGAAARRTMMEQCHVDLISRQLTALYDEVLREPAAGQARRAA